MDIGRDAFLTAKADDQAKARGDGMYRNDAIDGNHGVGWRAFSPPEAIPNIVRTIFVRVKSKDGAEGK